MDNVRKGIGIAGGSLGSVPGAVPNTGIIQSGLGGRDLKMKPNQVVRQRTAKDFT